MKTALQMPLLAIIMSLTMALSCDGPEKPQPDEVQGFYNSVLSGASAGTNLRFVKQSGPTTYWSYIVVEEDGRFYAVKFTDYCGQNCDGDTAHEFYQNTKFEVTDEDGDGNYDGNWKIFEESSSQKKDLEKMGALDEKRDHEDIVFSLIENYGLSEDRSHDVATLVKNWDKIHNSRGMTSKDQDIFLRKLTGSNKLDWEKALKGEVVLEDLVEKASRINNVSPEQFREILKDFLTK
jgi:hypothetical protein